MHVISRWLCRRVLVLYKRVHRIWLARCVLLRFVREIGMLIGNTWPWAIRYKIPAKYENSGRLIILLTLARF